MKGNTIVADPYQFLSAGVHATLEAAILTHIGRCGTIGAKASTLQGVVRGNYNTITTALGRLQDKGLLTRYARSNRQGRAYFWTVTGAGWELLTRPADLSMFPDSAPTPAP
jgi:DNA-binding MarR family transcriptional regulator